MARSRVTVKRAPLPRAPKITIRAGIIDGEKRYDDDESVGSIAEQQEFGLGVPERSWLRGWFDEHSPEVRAQAEAYLRDAFEGRRTFEAAAKLIAMLAAASIQRRIRGGQELLPITSPVTIARKQARGFHPPYTPLVETGLLVSSIAGDSEVVG